jgi:hypothetical protein
MTRRVLVTILASVLLAAWVVTADLLVPPPGPPEPVASEVPEPVAGQWVCPIGDDTPATRLAVHAVRPAVDDGLVSRVEVVTHADGEERAVGRVEVGEGAGAWLEPAGVTVARWEGGPSALLREWWFEGGDLPPALVAGGCVHGLSDRWVVPGLVTAGGAEARLRLTNPFRADATVAVGFLTPEGPAEPLALQNVSVGARRTVELVVNEYLPERDDLAAVVTVAVGRVAVEGVQIVRSAIGGTDGASLLAAAPAPAEQWTLPWVVDGPGRSTWLWVANPGEREAAIELTYLTHDGGRVPDGLTEVIVEPSTVRRVDLRGSLPADVDVVGVVVRSDGAPVVVSASVEIAHPDPARSAQVVQLGAPAADNVWVLAGGATLPEDPGLDDEPLAADDESVAEDDDTVEEEAGGALGGLVTVERDEQLHLLNPGSASSTVDVAVDTGSGVERPPALQGLVVPPGTRVAIDLGPHVEGARSWSATVLADGPGVVAAHVAGSATGPRRLLAVLGVPAAAWAPDGPPRPAASAPGLVQRIGTRFGVRADADPVPPAPPPGDSPMTDADDAGAPTAPTSLPAVPGERAEDAFDPDDTDPDADDADPGGDADGADDGSG